MRKALPAPHHRPFRMLPDGYTDKVMRLAEQVSDLNPTDMVSDYCTKRDEIVQGLVNLASEHD